MTPHDSELARLSTAQRAALRHVEDVVWHGEVTARSRVTEILQRVGCAADTYGEAMDCVREHARVVVHFYPHRCCTTRTTVAVGRMQPVMAALLAEIEEGGMATPPWPPFRAPTLGVPDLTVARLLRLLKEL